MLRGWQADRFYEHRRRLAEAMRRDQAARQAAIDARYAARASVTDTERRDQLAALAAQPLADPDLETRLTLLSHDA